MQAASRMLAHPVLDSRSEAGYPGMFWSSTRRWDDFAEYDSFFLGLIDVSPLKNQHHFRLVRGGK